MQAKPVNKNYKNVALFSSYISYVWLSIDRFIMEIKCSSKDQCLLWRQQKNKSAFFASYDNGMNLFLKKALSFLYPGFLYCLTKKLCFRPQRWLFVQLFEIQQQKRFCSIKFWANLQF